MAKSSTSFQKGSSGNPKGKPKGQTARGRFRELVDAALPDIVQRLLAAAQAGDVGAIKLVLDRCIPALRPTDDQIKLTMPAGADLVQQGEAIMKAVTSGALTTTHAKDLMTILASQRALVEQAEILERLEAIEQWLRKQPGEH